MTLTDKYGRAVTLPSSVLRLAVPEVNSSKGQLFIFESGWAGLEMVLALVKLGFAFIIHILEFFCRLSEGCAGGATSGDARRVASGDEDYS